MKKVFYNIVVTTCDTYEQSLYNLHSKIRLTPEEVVEYVTEDFNSTVDRYIEEDNEEGREECDLTVEKLEKLAVGSSIDVDFIPESDDCGNMYTWTIYKMEVEVTFPLDGREKLEDGVDVKFTDDED